MGPQVRPGFFVPWQGFRLPLRLFLAPPPAPFPGLPLLFLSPRRLFLVPHGAGNPTKRLGFLCFVGFSTYEKLKSFRSVGSPMSAMPTKSVILLSKYDSGSVIFPRNFDLL